MIRWLCSFNFIARSLTPVVSGWIASFAKHHNTDGIWFVSTKSKPMHIKVDLLDGKPWRKPFERPKGIPA